MGMRDLLGPSEPGSFVILAIAITLVFDRAASMDELLGISEDHLDCVNASSKRTSLATRAR